ncbi:HepT-like ribonuclease domain-containing protein [Acinetobacter baumannii]
MDEVLLQIRNVAAHDYQALSLPILRQILEERLPDFLEFSATLLRTLPNHEA